MCLNKPLKIKVPPGGITTYKLLRYDWVLKGYHSINFYHFWEVGETYTTGAADAHFNSFPGMEEEKFIDKDAFHTWTYLESAYGNWWYRKDEYKKRVKEVYMVTPQYVIAECTIPEDTKYCYVGVDDVNNPSYVSEKLVVNKFINPEELENVNADYYAINLLSKYKDS